MIYYVSGSTASLARYPDRRRFGFLMTPGAGNAPTVAADLGIPMAADNGAFSGFDEHEFRLMLAKLQRAPSVEWVAAPDVVCDWRATAALFAEWSDRIREMGLPVAYVAQDGQPANELPECECVFLGGSTEWKLSPDAAAIADAAAEAAIKDLEHAIVKLTNTRRDLKTGVTNNKTNTQ